ncbi:MAG TPA: hypothetical protein VKX16_03635 [Chloroflexota bacterium]|nr:hypothetical protein [Chloroflexota bacterium]
MTAGFQGAMVQRCEVDGRPSLRLQVSVDLVKLAVTGGVTCLLAFLTRRRRAAAL